MNFFDKNNFVSYEVCNYMCRIVIVVDSYHFSVNANPSLFNLVNKSPHLITKIASDLPG